VAALVAPLISQLLNFGDAGEVRLKGRSVRLTFSRSYLHLFQQM
jgi:hypothetical protein